MKRNVLLFFLIFPLFVVGQTIPDKQTKIDTLTAMLKRDSVYIYRFRKIRPYLNYHERNSVGNPKTINFFGPQVGVVLWERHIVGSGGYLSTRKTKMPYEAYDGVTPVKKDIDIRYLTVFYQYILIHHRFYELHLPVEYGHGDFRTRYNSAGNFYRKTVSDFNMGSGGVQLILKPVKWVGISSNFGYRFANEHIVDGYYYAIGVWLGFKPILTDYSYYLVKRRRYKRAIKAILAG